MRYVAVANLHLIRYTSRSQCKCISSGSDGEKRGPLVSCVLNNPVHYRATKYISRLLVLPQGGTG